MSSSSTRTRVVDVTMPQMGVSVAEGTVVAWRVEPGNRIEADQTICEISTDKIDTEVPAPVTGVVTEILVPVDTTVEVGEVLARIALEGGDYAGPASGGPTSAPGGEPAAPESAPRGDGAAASEPAPPRDVAAAPQRAATTRGATNGAPSPRRRYSPVVQRIASEHGIDLERVPATGRGGRVRKQDVLAFMETAEAGPLSDSPVEEAPLHIESPYRPEPPPATTTDRLSRIRRQIGEHMKRSLDTAAHCTTWIEVDMSRIEAARERLGLTALPFVAR
ncbi:MAG TPA: biotin/lipoyl-containing protein, partial [Solirubrobacteraceae bacterium]